MGLIVAHDCLATAAAIVASFYIRFEAAGLAERWPTLLHLPAAASSSMPASSISSSACYKSKWRFTSLPDLLEHRARRDRAGGLAAGARLRPGRAERATAQFFFGKITIAALLVPADRRSSAAPRVAYRYFRYTRTQQHARGGEADADARARPRRRRRSAAARDRERRGQEDLAGRHPVAVARPIAARRSAACRCSASFDDLEHVGRRPRRARHAIVARLMLTPSRARAGGAARNRS